MVRSNTAKRTYKHRAVVAQAPSVSTGLLQQRSVVDWTSFFVDGKAVSDDFMVERADQFQPTREWL